MFYSTILAYLSQSIHYYEINNYCIHLTHTISNNYQKHVIQLFQARVNRLILIIYSFGKQNRQLASQAVNLFFSKSNSLRTQILQCTQLMVYLLQKD